ncbi:hypothetical protein B0H11DRAFT_2194832, partial [Mycena galericulata]
MIVSWGGTYGRGTSLVKMQGRAKLNKSRTCSSEIFAYPRPGRALYGTEELRYQARNSRIMEMIRIANQRLVDGNGRVAVIVGPVGNTREAHHRTASPCFAFLLHPFTLLQSLNARPQLARRSKVCSTFPLRIPSWALQRCPSGEARIFPAEVGNLGWEVGVGVSGREIDGTFTENGITELKSIKTNHSADGGLQIDQLNDICASSRPRKHHRTPPVPAPGGWRTGNAPTTIASAAPAPVLTPLPPSPAANLSACARRRPN